MTRTLLAAALFAALASTASAQAWDDRDDYPDVRAEQDRAGDILTSLRLQLDRLRDDRRVASEAPDGLARAEDYISALEDRDDDPSPREVQRAQWLLGEVAREAGLYDEGEYDEGERDVIVMERDDPRARSEAERARYEADRARRVADQQREAAVAARLEADRERHRRATLERDLAGLQARETERGLVVTLGDVLFETGKADIKPGARRTLDQMIRALRADRSATLAIEGHTDSVGKRNYNLTLSQRRANAVRAYLVGRGIAANRILTRGLGPDYPVASNRTEAGRQQNRRVEMIVQNDD